MNERIYICHTFYHAYVTCLKEYHLRHGAMRSAGMPETTDPLSPEVTAIAGAATLVLSKMSNRFGTLADRARGCGLFENVVEFDEQPETAFPELEPLKRDTGSLVKNLLNRIRFCRRLGQLEEPFVPVDLTKYGDVYVFCDSDPIGYYLNYKKIRYHAVEDGLNCIEHFDAARFDNRGHFDLKAKVASTGLIFIQNGWSRYCIDMEVNDISRLEYPCPKYIELPRDGLVSELTQEDKDVLLKLFVENMEELDRQLSEGKDRPRVLILSEPLCDLETRARIFRDLVAQYGTVDGTPAVVMIKQHPRDLLDYRTVFAPEEGVILLSGSFPMEMLNFIRDLSFDRVVSVYTVVDSLHFVKEKVFLSHDFMDRYEDPSVHRKNEQIR